MNTELQPLAPGVVRLNTIFVNCYGIGDANGDWVLVDTALPNTAKRTQEAFETYFGGPPNAIVLTHAHFDHVGGAQFLADAWDVPVYLHRLEMPYVNGQSDYPPPDPTVGGPLALMSRFTKAKGTNLGSRGRQLEGEDSGEVPGLNGWQWIFTPGHAPGHIALWRESDNVLIAGDALATQNIDAWMPAIGQPPTFSNAGAPFICDWAAAHSSVLRLASLQPHVLACGHGEPMLGAKLPQQFAAFAEEFPMPEQGRYVHESARTNENGIEWLPPAPADSLPKIAAVLALFGAGLVIKRKITQRRA